MAEQRIRVLIAKPGLDGHDVGAKVVALALRDAGMEVIYTGLHQTPEKIAKTARDEAVDCVGLSVLSGAHVLLTRKVAEELRKVGRSDALFLVGGVIPDSDVEALKAAGAKGIFPTRSDFDAIVKFIRENTRSRAS